MARIKIIHTQACVRRRRGGGRTLLCHSELMGQGKLEPPVASQESLPMRMRGF
jgi:hypothetical protein